VSNRGDVIPNCVCQQVDANAIGLWAKGPASICGPKAQPAKARGRAPGTTTPEPRVSPNGADYSGGNSVDSRRVRIAPLGLGESVGEDPRGAAPGCRRLGLWPTGNRAESSDEQSSA